MFPLAPLAAFEREGPLLQGFKNFLFRGDVIVIAIGLIVATAFSTLVKSFSQNIINPIITRIQGKGSLGLGIQLGQSGNPTTFLNIGQLISDVIYFVVFMGVVYYLIVTPYKQIQARRGITVFGDPPPVKSCPACLSDDLNPGATRCKYCGSDLAVA
jgi:large conductance mechanosensitive channel